MIPRASTTIQERSPSLFSADTETRRSKSRVTSQPSETGYQRDRKAERYKAKIKKLKLEIEIWDRKIAYERLRRVGR